MQLDSQSIEKSFQNVRMSLAGEALFFAEWVELFKQRNDGTQASSYEEVGLPVIRKTVLSARSHEILPRKRGK